MSLFNNNDKGRRRPSARTGTTSATNSPSPSRPDGAPGPAANGELVIKLIGVGDASTGKSTFFRFWETNRINGNLKLTVSVDFHKREMNVQLPPVGFVAPSSPQFHAGNSGSSCSGSPIGGGRGGDSLATSVKNNSASPTRSTLESSGSPDGLPVSESSRSTFLLRSDSEEVSRKDFRIVAPTPLDFGPQGETIPTLVQVWDVQGQERSRNLTRIYYEGAMGALVFCEIKNAASLEGALQWKADIDSKVFVSIPNPDAPPAAAEQRNQVRSFRLSAAPAANQKPPAAAMLERKIPCWLVVNKCDLLQNNDQPAPLCMTGEHLDQFVKEHGFVGWCYASGLKGVHVKETVAALLSRTMECFPDEVRKKALGPSNEASESSLNFNNKRLRNDEGEKSKCSCLK